MPVESAADRAAFANPDEFGDLVTWSVEGVALDPFAAIFDNGTVLQDIGDGPGSLNQEATLRFDAALLPAGADAREDAVAVRGVDYIVKSVEPYGTGMIAVRLELVMS